MIFDVLIIGSGIVGCAVAQCLSRLKVKALVVERKDDVCEGTSKANSAILHAGFDARPGTLKARTNVLGNRLFHQLAKDLEITFKRNGSLVVSDDEEGCRRLGELLRRGRMNGVRQLGIVRQDELRLIEPNISRRALAALSAPTSGIVCPFEFNIALAENAMDNGVEFEFGEEVVAIEKGKRLFRVRMRSGRELEVKAVVNAAGVHADEIHNMICPDKLFITARKGEYLVLDKMEGYVRHTCFPLPTAMGKGILVTPTVHGNILLGPTAEDVRDKEETRTTGEGRARILEGASRIMECVPESKVINAFAGLRAHERGDDFIVGENPSVKGFVDCAGIESPGLTAAPALGAMVADLLARMLRLERKAFFTKRRKGIIRPAGMRARERKRLFSKNPDYARIICKCNGVTLGEIRDSVNRTLGATTLDGIKRRTYALMGRCQGSSCADEIARILADEKGIGLESITKKGGRSFQFEGGGDEDGDH